MPGLFRARLFRRLWSDASERTLYNTLHGYAAVSDSVQAAITPGTAAELTTRGYAVVDNVFGSAACRLLIAELQALKLAGRMHLNCTHLVRGGERSLLEKSRIYEADLTDQMTRISALQATLAAAPHFADIQADTTLLTMLNLCIPSLRLDTQAIKLQFNSGGGGCFPIHYDSDEAVDSRRVSAIVYLNPDWTPSDGGELRLYPSLGSCVDVEPIMDRLVLFSSCRMAHRVLPSTAERCCFTVWLSQAQTRASAPLSLQEVAQRARNAPEGWVAGQPEVRKCLTKLAHAEEWRESIKESHPESAARDDLLASFDTDTALLRKVLGSQCLNLNFENNGQWRTVEDRHNEKRIASEWF